MRFVDGVWQVKTSSTVYNAKKVIIATGFNRIPRTPSVGGLASFPGRTMHSRDFKSAARFSDKRVLVVGSGNSAVDIALDLRLHGANVDLVARSPLHVTPLNLLGVPAQVTSFLLSFLPLPIADACAMVALRLRFGDLSKYGILKPHQGPISMIVHNARPPTFDRGIITQIKKGAVRVWPDLTNIAGQTIHFANGASEDYDVLIFAIGYTTGLVQLLPDHGKLLTAKGWPVRTGRDMGQGLYFIGFKESPRGVLYDVNRDAKDIAVSIKNSH